MPNDLTWSQVNTAIGSNAISVSGGTVVIDVSVVLGDSITSLNDMKVVEFVYKLLVRCYNAQITANVGLTSNTLSSFSSPSYSSVQDQNGLDPTMDATMMCTVRVPLDTNLAVGPITS